jgi:hypothetical protein
MNTFYKKLLLLTAISIILSLRINYLYPIDLSEADTANFEKNRDSIETQY